VAQAERATRASFATAASLGRELCTMRLTLAIGSRSASPIAAPPCAHALCAQCLWEQQSTAFEVWFPFGFRRRLQKTAKKDQNARFVAKLNVTATCRARKKWRGRALLSTHIQANSHLLGLTPSLLTAPPPAAATTATHRVLLAPHLFFKIKRRSEGWITSWA